MSGDVWGEAVQKLAQHFTVHCVDLPGYGASKNIAPHNLDTLVDCLSEYYVGQTLTVCGWSLGGQIALRWAERMPQQVQRLILLATTPCFVQRADWLCAMPLEIFQEFAQDIQQSPEKTLKRFIALQVRGGKHEKYTLAKLRSNLLSRGQPNSAALRDGLVILRETDLRASLPHIKQPVLIIAGEKDELVPAAAADYLAQHLPNFNLVKTGARLIKIPHAAHVPFLSYTDEFVMQVKNFIEYKGK